MDRVAFLMESTNQRVSALLNPESLRVRRLSGLKTLANRPGTIAGAGGADDVLLATGGGRTEVELDLVFDVDLVMTEPAPRDVRDLTGPIWRLAENDSAGRLQPFRLIWGTRWNVLMMVEAVSERFDRFDHAGNPLRSWLSLRALRIAEPDELPKSSGRDYASAVPLTPRAPSTSGSADEAFRVTGGGPSGVRIDEVADDLLDGPADWRTIADSNDLDMEDLPWISPWTVLSIVPDIAR